MNTQNTTVESGLIVNLTEEEKKLIIEEAEKFFDRYGEEESFMSKLSSLEAAVYALDRYNPGKQYEPKSIFDIIYAEFGNRIFSQYSRRECRAPTPAQLHKPTIEFLVPAAYYFARSAALWEYGMRKFNLDPRAVDRRGNSALMMATKHRQVAGAISMINTAPTVEERIALVQHKNCYGDNAMVSARYAIRNGGTGYNALIQLLLFYSGVEEKPKYLM